MAWVQSTQAINWSGKKVVHTLQYSPWTGLVRDMYWTWTDNLRCRCWALSSWNLSMVWEKLIIRIQKKKSYSEWPHPSQLKKYFCSPSTGLVKLVSMPPLLVWSGGLGLVIPLRLSKKLGRSTACREEANVWLGSSSSITWLVNSSGLMDRSGLCDSFELCRLDSALNDGKDLR